jgi:hypothetical protein
LIRCGTVNLGILPRGAVSYTTIGNIALSLRREDTALRINNIEDPPRSSRRRRILDTIQGSFKLDPQRIFDTSAEDP